MMFNARDSLSHIFSHFTDIESQEFLCTHLSSGLIHTTYRINTPRASYILQKIHPTYATRAHSRDMAAVTNELRARGIESPKLLQSKNGDFLHEDDDGGLWRLQTCLPGVTHVRAPDRLHVEKAGAALGSFHTALDTFEYTFEARETLHSVVGSYETFLELYLRNELSRELQYECEYLMAHVPKALQGMPKLAHSVVHNDPKISNIIYNESGDATLIDLDTCSRGLRPIDVGDALRSWCKDTSSGTAFFNYEYASAALGTYLGIARETVSLEEMHAIPAALRLVTLELAMRYVLDSLQQKHFAWDAKKYTSARDHNIVRARECVAYEQGIEYKRIEEMLQRLVEHN